MKPNARSPGSRSRMAAFALPGVIFFVIAAITALPASSRADVLRGTKPVQISGKSPFVGCTADNVGVPGTNVPHWEVEPWLAVNPTNPANLVAVWFQDPSDLFRGGRGLVAAVSFDGGMSWKNVVIPGFTLCSGGIAHNIFDPWLSFSPNGDLYVSGGGAGVRGNGNLGPPFTILVSKSTDGGVTWGPVVTLIEDKNSFQDKESITADPADPSLAYVVWNVSLGAVMFARTTDGGQSWEPARPIYNPPSYNLPIGNQIVVLADGTLVNFFSEGQRQNDGGAGFHFDPGTLSVIRSRDKGVTWEPNKPIQIAEIKTTQCSGSTAGFPCVTDPETGQLVRDAIIFFDVALDPNNGNLYLQWTDGRFSDFQFPSVAFSMSTDGGFTWSTPIKINQTPTNIPPGNQQTFGHSIHVAPDGTVGVAYYDFRFNDPSPGLLTDYWLVHCDAGADCTDPANWSDENRLTSASFDMEKAPSLGGSLFVGDYQGMASDGGDLLTVWGQPHGKDPGSIFFERIKLGRAGPASASPAVEGKNDAGSSTAARGVVRVFDVAGRLVRTLPETSASGWETVRWDGRLGDGRLAPNGLYFLQLRLSDGSSAVKRTVIVR